MEELHQSPTDEPIMADSPSLAETEVIELKQSDDDNPSFKRFILDALETVAIALIIFFVIYNFIAQPHLVKGESMQPNYFEGEYILTSKLYRWLGEPQRGDVIVLKSPDDPSVQFIKRVIGLPGEKIRLQNNQVFIYNQSHPDGVALQEDYLPANLPIPDGGFLTEGQTVEIPTDNFVVMGDNRPASYDSRNWGLLPREKIVGKAFFVYWPIPSFGFVAHADYHL